MWFAPRTLSLITTHRCTAACEHCSPAAAEARVRDLDQAGLGELNLSTGVFHARFVPWERVLWAALAAAGHQLVAQV